MSSSSSKQGQGKGLRLTTSNIRSTKSNTRRKVDLGNKLKTNARKMSIVKVQKNNSKRHETSKTLNAVMQILDRCKEALEPVNYEDLMASIQTMNEFYHKTESVITTQTDWLRYHNATANRDTPIQQKQVDAVLALLDERMTNIRKSQASFKRKLERLTDSIKIIESSRKLVEGNQQLVQNSEQSLIKFKKHLCIEMKSNFDPLFTGSIGYEGGKRTDPYSDNLQKSVWDSKTSKG